MPSNPEETLLQGSEFLKPLFTKYGFIFVPLEKGKSSGGPFASASFNRGDRKLEFHFRFSLGMVTYHLGAESITHQEYMCSVLGKPNLSRYPGFSNDPLDAFWDLHDDVENHCIEFLEGTNDAFLRRIADARICWARIPKLPG